MNYKCSYCGDDCDRSEFHYIGKKKNKCRKCHNLYCKLYHRARGRQSIESLMAKRDLTSRKIGKWNVIRKLSMSRSGATQYECKCECGTIKPVLATHLVSNKSLSCGCDLPKGIKHKQFGGYEEITGNFWDSVKRGASGTKDKRRPIEFDLTMEDAWRKFIAQNRKCALTGLPLIMNYHRKTGPTHTASIDRIDSGKGYTINNIQWVHKDINRMKNSYSQEYFVEMCKRVAANV